MPDIGFFHPQIVHFVVALVCVGVAARVASLLPLFKRSQFLGPMAALLIVLGAGASWFAAKSGMDAHGPAERVPGAREAVTEHEDWGMRGRNVLLALGLLEIAALALASRARLARGIQIASGLLGLAGLFVLYEAAEHGGELVYAYAGGVGTRSGDERDVQRLLIAGLYHQAQAARKAGRKEEAARHTAELARQLPADDTVKLLVAESMIQDREDSRAALMALSVMELPDGNARLQIRRGMLAAEAYQAAGVPDSARLTLEELLRRYPDSPRVQAAIERMNRKD